MVGWVAVRVVGRVIVRVVVCVVVRVIGWVVLRVVQIEPVHWEMVIECVMP